MMQKGKIKRFQMLSLSFFLVQSFILGVCVKEIMVIGRESTWIAALVGSVVGYLLLLLYWYIYKHQRNKDILDYNNKIFGKGLGKAINILLELALIFLFMLVMREIVEFINLQFLVETPNWALNFVFSATIVIAVIYGLETFAKTAQVLFLIMALMIIAVIIGVGRISEVSNLKPFFEVGLMPFLQTVGIISIYSAFPMFMLLIIPPRDIDEKEKVFKSISIGYGLGCFVNVLAFFLPISIFGINLALLYDCSNYAMVKKMNLLSFVERIENVVVIIKILPAIFLCIFILYFVIQCFQKNFKIKKEKTRKILVVVIGLFLSLVSSFIFPNDTVANEWLLNPLLLISSFSFVLIPIVISIVTFLKYKKKRML